MMNNYILKINTLYQMIMIELILLLNKWLFKIYYNKNNKLFNQSKDKFQ